MPPKRKSKAKVKINNKLENKNVIIINQVDKRRPRRRRVSKPKPKAEEQQTKPLMPPVITQMPSYAGSASFNSRTYQPELTKPQPPIANIQLKKSSSTMTIDTKDTIKEFFEKEQQTEPQSPKVSRQEREQQTDTPQVFNEDTLFQPTTEEKYTSKKVTEAYNIFEKLRKRPDLYDRRRKNRDAMMPKKKFEEMEDKELLAWIEKYSNLLGMPVPAYITASSSLEASSSLGRSDPRQVMISRPIPDTPFTPFRRDTAEETKGEEAGDDNEDMLS